MTFNNNMIYKYFTLLFTVSIIIFSCRNTSKVTTIHNNLNEKTEENKPLLNAIYEEWRITAKPSNNAIVTQNPPSLLWKSEKHFKK